MNFQSRTPIVFESPIIVFGGPYSNLHALDALLVEAKRLGIAPDHMISTGDLVAYCADARDVVDRIREEGIRFIRGNCEDQIAAGAGDCGCGFAPGGECDRLSADWFAHAMRELDEARRAFLGRAPERLDIVMNGARIAVVHGAATQQNRFVFASTPQRVKALDLDLLDVDAIVAGHSGLPFTQSVGRRLWHNAGALGMPANEGDPRVWYSVIAPGDEHGALTIEHCALSYDHRAAADAMARAGLPGAYARTLVDGLWPNCDALPLDEASAQGCRLEPAKLTFTPLGECLWPPLSPPIRSEGAAPAAAPIAPFRALETLWINTGSLCNLACASCYLDSSPRNDRLAYISAAEVQALLDEIAEKRLPTRVIGFTGGEPFLNRDLVTMLADALARGHDALVLTNAMKPMRKARPALLDLRRAYGPKLTFRVSVDHYTRELHELERGARSFEPTLEGLVWLSREGFAVSVAGRLYSGEPEQIVRAGYAALFAARGLALDAFDPSQLVLFPEMERDAPTGALDEQAWSAVDPPNGGPMCVSSRMAVKRKGADALSIVACTLLPYEPQFELGADLSATARPVALSHAHCATFCLRGGASCSA